MTATLGAAPPIARRLLPRMISRRLPLQTDWSTSRPLSIPVRAGSSRWSGQNRARRPTWWGWRWLAVALLTGSGAGGCAHRFPPATAATATPFRFERDAFTFANETVFNYRDGRLHGPTGARSRQYTRRCFVVARAATQFWKFARFDPTAAPLDERALAARVRAVTRRPVWGDPLPRDRRVVIPGSGDLRSLSAARPAVLQENLGLGWPTYFRPGNYCIVFPPGHAHQARTDRELTAALARHQPVILWLANFPGMSINHTVVVYAPAAPDPEAARVGAEAGVGLDGAIRSYWVYDPNYPGAPRRLSYHPDQERFTYGKTFYFPGGTVRVRPVYLSPLQ